MLTRLFVKNLAIVEKLDLSLKSGMNVITGETGAGKSVLLQALSLALGSRCNSDLVRAKNDKAEVITTFEIDNHKKIKNYLEQKDLYEGEECILRRIINSDGRSKSFINGVNVPLTMIKNIGEMLVDMHYQNDNQLLLQPIKQMELLDSYAGISNDILALNKLVKEYKEISKNIDKLNKNQELTLQQQEFFKSQLKELDEAGLNKKELENIEHEFKVSENAKDLIEKTSHILHQLDNENGINQQLLNIDNELNKLLNFDSNLSLIAKIFSSSQIQIQEVIYEINNYISKLPIDEQSANELEQRLSELHNLARKHNCQITELLDAKQKISICFNEINDNNLVLNDLKQKQTKLAKQYKNKANKISIIRGKKAKKMAHEISQIMQVLGMKRGEIKINLIENTDDVSYFGLETISFLIKTNTGQSFKPLNKIASGGEMSRIALAIAIVGSNDKYVPTLVFDEADSGISGAVAETVGKKLRELSLNYQVFCITHLAQVAAFGHQHLKVYKYQQKSNTQIIVKQLNYEDRIAEIARISGGKIITEKVLTAARERLELASK
jgi:DNA repair protein RecN (Recombination protein N)